MKITTIITIVAVGLTLIAAGAYLQTGGTEKPVAEALTRLFNDGPVELPINWGDLGRQLQKNGTIDRAKFDQLYAGRGGMHPDLAKLLDTEVTSPVMLTEENSGELLNLFWAFGLANKNPILEEGPMSDPRYGGAGRFASTGGWDLSAGDSMNHYSAYQLVVLTPDQQALVEEVSRNIYRPCCDNPTHFPDCNHGMALLGLLELMAANDVGEEELYRMALLVQQKWFPETYRDIREYARIKRLPVEFITAKRFLGRDYSSASGYARVRADLAPSLFESGTQCSA